jgi:hypothetical protein
MLVILVKVSFEDHISSLCLEAQVDRQTHLTFTLSHYLQQFDKNNILQARRGGSSL